MNVDAFHITFVIYRMVRFELDWDLSWIDLKTPSLSNLFVYPHASNLSDSPSHSNLPFHPQAWVSVATVFALYFCAWSARRVNVTSNEFQHRFAQSPDLDSACGWMALRKSFSGQFQVTAYALDRGLDILTLFTPLASLLTLFLYLRCTYRPQVIWPSRVKSLTANYFTNKS